MTETAAAVLVFSKSPDPGTVKTRLQSSLDNDAIVELYKKLIRKTLLTACSHSHFNVQLWCTPSTDSLFFRQMCSEFPVTLFGQEGEDLGARMRHAFSSALTVHPRVLVVGCDCPGLDTSDLITADEKLQDGIDCVLGPAHDGGYYLLGLAAPRSELFTGIPWGSSEVLAMTKERLVELGLSIHELQARADIDRPEDLALVQGKL